MEVEIGPDHNDKDGSVDVTVTTLDVNNGVANTADNEFTHTIRIRAIADIPSVDVVQTPTTVDEDGANIPLTIVAGPSADKDDGSESLSVRITVPSDTNGRVGDITGTLPSGVSMDQDGDVWTITASGATAEEQATKLNSFLNNGGIELDPRENWAGNLTGTNGLLVEGKRLQVLLLCCFQCSSSEVYSHTLSLVRFSVFAPIPSHKIRVQQSYQQRKRRMDSLDIKITRLQKKAAPKVKQSLPILTSLFSPLPTLQIFQ